MDKLLSAWKQNGFVNTIFVSSIFISIHYALVVYLNSTFLSQFFSETQVSSLYIIGSVLTIFFLLNASKLLERIGVYRFTLYAAAAECLAVFGMGVSSAHFLIGFYFLVQLTAVSLVFFAFDLLLKDFLGDDTKTGGVRATYLTIMNLTTMLVPSGVALLLLYGGYRNVYILAAAVLLPMYVFIRRLKSMDIGPVRHIRIRETALEYAKSRNLYNAWIVHFLLWLFYAFMIVYTPLYMNRVVGFSWPEIGLIFTIMLAPFVFIELPVGELADEKYGEKEFLTVGFVVMGLATLFLSFITVKSFWIWAIALFITRVGASFVEISSDAYFFKKVDKEKTDVIGFYRMTHPLSFVAAPVLATILLQFIPFQYLFIAIGTLLIVGTRYSLALEDTK